MNQNHPTKHPNPCKTQSDTLQKQTKKCQQKQNHDQKFMPQDLAEKHLKTFTFSNDEDSLHEQMRKMMSDSEETPWKERQGASGSRRWEVIHYLSYPFLSWLNCFFFCVLFFVFVFCVEDTVIISLFQGFFFLSWWGWVVCLHLFVKNLQNSTSWFFVAVFMLRIFLGCSLKSAK